MTPWCDDLVWGGACKGGGGYYKKWDHEFWSFPGKEGHWDAIKESKERSWPRHLYSIQPTKPEVSEGEMNVAVSSNQSAHRSSHQRLQIPQSVLWDSMQQAKPEVSEVEIELGCQQ